MNNIIDEINESNYLDDASHLNVGDNSDDHSDEETLVNNDDDKDVEDRDSD